MRVGVWFDMIVVRIYIAAVVRMTVICAMLILMVVTIRSSRPSKVPLLINVSARLARLKIAQFLFLDILP